VQEHHNPFVYKLVGMEALQALCEELNMPLACAADLSTSDAASAETRSQTASPSLPASVLADDSADTRPQPDSALVDSGGTEPFAAGAHPSAAGVDPALTDSQQDQSATASAGLAPGYIGGEGPAAAHVGPEVADGDSQQQQRHEAVIAGGSSAEEPVAGARRPQDILARLAEICGDDLGRGQHQADMPASSARQRVDSPSPHVLSSGLAAPRAVRSAGSQRDTRERQLERLLRAVEARSSQRMDEADGGAPRSAPAWRPSGAGRRRLSDPLERPSSAYELPAAPLREAARSHRLALSAEPLPGGRSSRRVAAPSPLQTVTASGQDALRRRRLSRHAGDGDSLLPLNSAESVRPSLRVVDHSAVGEPHARASDPQSAAAPERAAIAEPVPPIQGDSAPDNGSEAEAVEATALAEGSAAGASRRIRHLSEISSPARPPVAAATANAGHAMAEAQPVPESTEPEGHSGIGEGEVGSGDGAPGGSASDAAAVQAPQEGPPPDTATDDDQDLIMLPPPEPTMVDLTVLVR